MSIINAKHFQDETAAYEYVEARVWPNGPVCPKCGATKEHVGKLGGESTRIGTYKCYACRKPFTVKVGTIFESSHVKLHLWLQAIYLMCASKKGISSNQLHRTLGVTLKTAWFMSHRIRLAMDPNAGTFTPMGGKGVTVEADETYIAKSRKTRRVKGERPDVAIMTLVERGGQTRSIFLDERSVRSMLPVHLHPESRLVTDGAQHYKFVMPTPDQHESVDHSKKEYVRGDVHTNTAEGFFSIFKRGLVGTYQHIESQHVERYLAEFDFRMNNRAKLGVNDEMRTEIAVQGVVGKRLTYRTTSREG
jgi:transposase-like protein